MTLSRCDLAAENGDKSLHGHRMAPISGLQLPQAGQGLCLCPEELLLVQKYGMKIEFLSRSLSALKPGTRSRVELHVNKGVCTSQTLPPICLLLKGDDLLLRETVVMVFKF